MKKIGLIEDYVIGEKSGLSESHFIRAWQGNCLPEIPDQFWFSELGWLYKQREDFTQRDPNTDPYIIKQEGKSVLEQWSQWDSSNNIIYLDYQNFTKDCLYYFLMQSRAMEGIEKEQVYSNDVKEWMKLYCYNEILPNIELGDIQLWISYDSSERGCSYKALKGKTIPYDITKKDKISLSFLPQQPWYQWFLKISWNKR